MTAAADLLVVMQNWPRPVFVAIDGALLPDVPGLTAKADVFPRSLFVEQSDPTTVQAGPWFASLDERHLESLMRIEGIEMSAVFWGGPVEESTIFRHLRSINLVDVPRPTDAPFDPFAADPETVLFRHWDPSVMALTLPVLEPAQRARLFGPMDSLALYDPSLGGSRDAKRRIDWPEPTRGRIRISKTQLASIAAAMTDRSRRTIATFLRDAAPTETAYMDNAALDAFIADSEISGRELGLTTERGLSRWSYLMLISNGAIATIEPARAFLAAKPGTPDERIGRLMLGVADELGRRRSPA
ncbi:MULTISPECIES: DUF4123 domain-containing protein [Acidiphilium]|uniref:DUF4123 domain-containing protein n=1 Tax=Acidiphilium rubrum TaxID=526 RepID=A0A8G2CNN4_ACIRU|nr:MULTISPECIES: DUF4123 domain-containing protein [Acidiphilium]SIR47114.1 protein of unknown function [Acidiphilium rubrum]